MSDQGQPITGASSFQTGSGGYAQSGPIALGASPLPKRRNVVLVWLVWPLLTLGIYHLVWYYKINRETNFNPNTKTAPFVSLIAVMFGWILIVPPFVSV